MEFNTKERNLLMSPTDTLTNQPSRGTGLSPFKCLSFHPLVTSASLLPKTISYFPCIFHFVGEIGVYDASMAVQYSYEWLQKRNDTVAKVGDIRISKAKSEKFKAVLGA